MPRRSPRRWSSPDARGSIRARFLEVARAGSSGSTMLELKAEPMLADDFEPLFKLEHMLKDMRHCLAEAALGANRAWARRAAVRAKAAADGHADQDFAAVITAAS